MKRFAACVMVGFLSMMVVHEAQAASLVVRNVNLRAGPDEDYPAIIRLRKNSAVRVHGCIDDWYWCDVSSGRYRGWIMSDYIQTRYNRRNVAFVDAAPRMNIPILSFNIGYWDEHYRNNAFYRDRGKWERHGWRDRDHNWHGRDDHDWRGRDRDDRDGRYDNDRGDRYDRYDRDDHDRDNTYRYPSRR